MALVPLALMFVDIVEFPTMPYLVHTALGRQHSGV